MTTAPKLRRLGMAALETAVRIREAEELMLCDHPLNTLLLLAGHPSPPDCRWSNPLPAVAEALGVTADELMRIDAVAEEVMNILFLIADPLDVFAGRSTPPEQRTALRNEHLRVVAWRLEGLAWLCVNRARHLEVGSAPRLAVSLQPRETKEAA